MKSFIASLILISSFASQASTVECFSLDEGITPRLQIKVGKAVTMNDGEGRRTQFRSVEVKVQGVKQAPVDALGKVTKAVVELYLVKEGDISVGYLNAKADKNPMRANRLSGTVQLSTVHGNRDIAEAVDCIYKK